MDRTCFFHAGCPDGFGAAWSVWRAWDGAGRFIARGHGDEDPISLLKFYDQAPV